jgi:hypothetical protein
MNVAELIEVARASAGRGDMGAARAACERALILDANCSPALVFLLQIHRERGAIATALPHARRLAELHPSQVGIWQELGNLAFAGQHWPEAAAAFGKALQLRPDWGRGYLLLGTALVRMGQDDQALMVWSLGEDRDPELIRSAATKTGSSLQDQQLSLEADTALRRHFTDLHEASISGLPGELSAIRSAIWPQTHLGDVKYRHPDQHPYIFYLPDVAPIEVFARRDLPWLSKIEAVWPDILAEFSAAREELLAQRKPYIPAEHRPEGEAWDPIAGEQNWTSLYLYRKGQENTDIARHFPKTCAAVRHAPLVQFEDQPMEVFFSILQGGQRIPPHFGLANTAMTVHLPVLVPGKAFLRCGTQTLSLAPGEMFAFDDSFDHEAWNEGEAERVVLIFEAWRPDLSPDEIRAIETSFEARDAWLAARKLPEPMSSE